MYGQARPGHLRPATDAGDERGRRQTEAPEPSGPSLLGPTLAQSPPSEPMQPMNPEVAHARRSPYPSSKAIRPALANCPDTLMTISIDVSNRHGQCVGCSASHVPADASCGVDGDCPDDLCLAQACEAHLSSNGERVRAKNKGKEGAERAHSTE